MLRIELLGSGRAFVDETPIPSFPRQQHFLLLCYLLLNLRRPLLRDQLAAVFWGDYPIQPARKYLRNALWKLRQALDASGAPSDQFLLISDESISFLHSGSYQLDIERFENGILPFQDIPGQQLSPQQAGELEKTVEIYTGDLLEGVYDDWTLYDRERLSLLYTAALSKLITYHEVHGHYERGLAYAERILARDNTREQIHLQMMRLYWLSGDRPSALAQYRRCKQILHEELNIQPMQETSEVYQRMIHNQYPSATSAPRLPADRAANLNLNDAILIRLQQLQKVIEDTRSELVQLEELLSQPLPAPPAVSPPLNQPLLPGQ